MRVGSAKGGRAGLAVLLVAALAVGCSSPVRPGERGSESSAGDRASPDSLASATARPGPTALDTVAENALPGTRAWRLRWPGPAAAIEGFSDHVSIRPGQSFRLFVSTTAAGFRVSAYRMGWYHGAGGRELWQSGHLRGIRQAAPTVARATNTVTAGWKPAVTVPTTNWPEGDYLIKLVADNGHDRYVPLTVRSADTAGRVVLVNAVTTWQAYNLWGGYNLYRGRHGFADRARAVSFDRPYDQNGAGKFLNYERPVVELAERLGVRLAYETSIELAGDRRQFSGARALVTMGHDEYWTTSMRNAAAWARDRGTNLVFLGANAVNRHIRLAATPLGGNRLVICYKSADEDPMARRDPDESTQDWRLLPHRRPESVLTGAMYDCFPADADYVISDPRGWPFAGTGVHAGTRFRGLVGVESDRLHRDEPFPRPIEVLSDSAVNCGGRATRADSTYYTVASGAGVLNVGTMNWVGALRRFRRFDPSTWSFVRKVTENVLKAVATGPVGLVHRAHDNVAAFSRPPASPA